MSINTPTTPIVILRLPQVVARVGFHRSTLYARIKEGTFPKPIKLGESERSASGWIEAEINEWLEQQRAKTRN